MKKRLDLDGRCDILIVQQFVGDTLDTIALLNRNERVTQALILLYSAIDTLAWLSVPGGTSRSAFKTWVDKYLLQDSGLQCNASDLYAARCGLLHTHAAESSGSATGAARQIWYWTGTESKKLLEYEASGRNDVVLVRFSDLVAALVAGADRFLGDLAAAPERAAMAQVKARQWLAWVPAPPVSSG